ncbi:MAG TPA: hypothetical protein VGN00_29455 [Puia sp.]|jgi:hypothetical protein
MQFRSKLVISRRNKRAYLAYAGLLIAASSLLLVFIPSLSDDIPYVFGTGIAIVVIGALIARGDVRNYGLSAEDLTVNRDGITVGTVFYPLQMVSELDFNVEAYSGMYVNDGAMVSGSNSDGMTNELSFVAGGQRVKCGFYLESKEHALQLGLLFDEFYQRRIPFVEHNRSTRTYLLKVLNEKELEEFKRRYGYV